MYPNTFCFMKFFAHGSCSFEIAVNTDSPPCPLVPYLGLISVQGLRLSFWRFSNLHSTITLEICTRTSRTPALLCFSTLHNNFGAVRICYLVHVFCCHSTSGIRYEAGISPSITPLSLFQKLCKYTTFPQAVKRGKTSQQMSHSVLSSTSVLLQSLWQLCCLNQPLFLSHWTCILVNMATSHSLGTSGKPACFLRRATFSCSQRCLDAVLMEAS